MNCRLARPLPLAALQLTPERIADQPGSVLLGAERGVDSVYQFLAEWQVDADFIDQPQKEAADTKGHGSLPRVLAAAAWELARDPHKRPRASRASAWRSPAPRWLGRAARPSR